MKGFLSFLGITLITVAFGLILFSFFGNPLEESKVEERQLAYHGMRTNQSVNTDNFTISKSPINTNDKFYIENGQSCTRLSFKQ